jgi:hypothetical protein
MSDIGAGTATPILDLLRQLPKPQADDFASRKYFPLATIAIMAVVFRNYELLVAIIGFVSIALLTTAIHELGHVSAGCSLGLRFESVAIGPIWVRREYGRWTVNLRRHLTSGLTFMSLDRICRVRRRLTIYVAAGPAASVLTGTIALLGSRVAIDHDDAFVATILICFGVYSLYISCLSLRPVRYGHFASDGMLLRALNCSREKAKQLLAQHALVMQRRRHNGPFLRNSRWTQLANSGNGFGDPVHHAYITDWNAYGQATHTEEAAQFLERCLAGCAFLNAEDRDTLILEASIFTAWRRNDSVRADVWFNRAVCPERIHPLVRLRAEAALSCVHQRFGDALQCLERGLEILRQLPASGKGTQLEASWSN